MPDKRVEGYDGQAEVWEIVDRGEPQEIVDRGEPQQTAATAEKGGK